MTMKQMLDLGAPPLPEGFFYRIGTVGLDGVLCVSIMRERRHWLLGDKRLMSARMRLFTSGGDAVPVEKAVRLAAEEAFNDWDRGDVIDRWKGDHK